MAYFGIEQDDPEFQQELARIRASRQPQQEQGGFKAAFKQALGSQVQGVGQLAADLGWDDNAIESYGKSVQQANPTTVHSLGDIVEHPWQAFKEGTGMALGYLAPGVVGRGLQVVGGAAKLAGLARAGAALNSMPVQAGMAALPSYGGIREDQEAEGHNDWSDKALAALGAGAVGAIETGFGAQRAFGIGRGANAGALPTKAEFVKQLGATPWRTAGKAAGRTIGEEMGEELVQNPIEQLAAYQNPTSAENINETLTGAALAGMGTLGLGGFGGARMGLRHSQINQRMEQDLLNPEQTPLGDLRESAEWKQAFMNRDGEAGDHWYDELMRDQFALRNQQVYDAGIEQTKDRIFAGDGDKIPALDRNRLALPAPVYEMPGSMPEQDAAFANSSEAAEAVRRNEELWAARDAEERQRPRLEGFAKLPAPGQSSYVMPAEGSTAQVDLMRLGTLEDRAQATSTAERQNALLAEQQDNRPISDGWNFNAQNISVPQDLGSAIGVLRQAVEMRRANQPIVSGSDMHQALLEADSIVRQSGYDPKQIVQHYEAPQQTTKGTNAPQTQQVAPQTVATPAAQAGSQQTTPPAAQGVKQTTPRGAASQAFEAKLNTAVTEGKIAQDDPIITDWHASKKLKADAVSFGQALDDKLAGPDNMPLTAEQSLQQKAVGTKQKEEEAKPGKIKVIKIVDGKEVSEWVDPADVAKANRGKKGGTVAESQTPLQDLSEDDRALVNAFLGLDEDGDIDPEATPKTHAQLAAQFGISHTTSKNRLDALGYTQDYKNKLHAGAVINSSSEFTEDDSSSRSVKTSDDLDFGVGKGNASQHFDGEVGAEEVSEGGNLRVQNGTGAKGATDTGKGWEELLAANVAFSHRSKSTGQHTWKDSQLAEAVASGKLNLAQTGKIVTEIKRRDVDRIVADEVAARAAKKKPMSEAEVAALRKRLTKASPGTTMRDLEEQDQAADIAKFEKQQAENWNDYQRWWHASVNALDVLENAEAYREVEQFWNSERITVPGRKGRVMEFADLPFDIKTTAATIFARYSDRPSVLADALAELQSENIDRIFNDYVSPVRGGSYAADGVSGQIAGGQAAGNSEGATGTDTNAGPVSQVPKPDVKIRKKRRVAVADEAAGRSDSEGQAGEVDGKLYRRETLVFTDSTGQHFSEEVESIDIRNTEDLLNALDDVAYNQLSGTLDYVSGFHATDSLDAYAYPNGDGTYKIVLPRALLSGHPETLTRVLHHELGHVADAADAVNGGKNSSGIAMGVMVQKAKALYDKLPANSKLKKHLEYPFHSKYPESGSAKMQRTELYAQLVSAYLDPELSAELRAVHPTLFNFAESIVNEIEEQYQEDAESSDAGVGPSRVVHQGNNAVVRQRGAAAQQTRDQFGKTGTQVMDDARDVVSRGFKWFMSLHDLVSEYKAQLPSASSWYDSVRATIATRNKMEADAEAIAARAGKNEKHLGLLNKFLAQSTLEQKWGYDATFTRSDGTKHVVKADPQMAQAFNRLPVEVQQLVKDIFAHGEKMKDTKYTTMRELGIKDPILQAGALTGPYAPLKRFGDHIVVLKSKELVAAEKAGDQKKVDELKKNGKHYVVSSFDTKGQAKAFERENAAKYESAVTFKGSEKLDLGHQMNTQTLQKLQASLKLEKIDKRAKEQFENLLKDMYLRAFDEHSARMSGLKRMNRAGFNEDMVRSFLSHARAEAGFLANMKHGAKTNEEYYKIEQEAKQDRYAGQDAFNAITQHYVANLEHKDTPIQDRFLALTTFQQLATNPAYHIQNLLQPVMVSVPRLAADFNNYAGAWTALRQGYAIVRKAVSGGLINDAKIDLSKVENQKLRDMLQAASDAGLLDVGMDEDLTKFESTQTGYGAVDKTSALMKKVVHKMRQTARRVEATNRISTAVAAFNMSYAKEANEAKATAYAISVLQDTQGDFSKTDAPLIIKKLPKFVVQYRKFQLMMAAHYVKAFRDMFHGVDLRNMEKDNSEEAKMVRAVGRRAMAISLGHAFMASGVMGLPLMNLVGLAFAASGDDDEPKDLERSLREWIGDADTANFLLHSPLYFMGLDAKLSQDKIFSILPYADWNLTSKKGVMNLGAGLAGPSGSNAMKMADGLGNMAKGEYYDGLIGLLPSGLSNGVKAFEMANKGYTLKNGDVMVKPEDINEFGLLMDSMGLKSPGTRRMDWYKNQQWEVKQFYSDRTKEIEHQYADAAKSGDTEKLSELRQDWQDLQAGKDHLRYIFGDQHDELKRQPLSNLLKYPQTQAKRERKLQKSVPQEL